MPVTREEIKSTFDSHLKMRTSNKIPFHNHPDYKATVEEITVKVRTQEFISFTKESMLVTIIENEADKFLSRMN
jgi:hypothetical protein